MLSLWINILTVRLMKTHFTRATSINMLLQISTRLSSILNQSITISMFVISNVTGLEVFSVVTLCAHALCIPPRGDVTPSRCGSVPRMRVITATTTPSEICDISVYYGAKESDLWRSDGENIRSAARDKPEQRQRWQIMIRYHISLMIGYELTVIIRCDITVILRHDITVAILVLLSDMTAVLLSDAMLMLSDMISCY